METAVAIEWIIERHDNEKIILKFLICLNHFHRIIYRKPCCKVGIFLSIVSDKLAGLESSAEKVQHFQKYCRIHYKEFVNMYPFLRSVAKKTKTKNEIKKKKWQEKNLKKKLEILKK